jgi:molybdopterin-guanine dinucleotide biosynthesis protein A
MIDRGSITGLVLCGGRGLRMGGLDKGLQAHRGQPLAAHALQRLRPQVGAVLLNANRNLAAYAALGAPVCSDTLPGHLGPLAGWLAGLERCATPYLLGVPCDTPNFPIDIAQRLLAALLEAGAELAVAATLEGEHLRPQPVFCLMRAGLRSQLQTDLAAGERRVGAWTARQRQVQVVFDDAAAFANANTWADLQALA